MYGFYGERMNRVEALNKRYEICTRIDGAPAGPLVIEAIPDSAGARFDQTLRNIIASLKDDAVSFEELLSPAKALRWKRLFHAQPVTLDARLQVLAEQVIKQCSLMEGALDDQFLDELSKAAEGVADNDSGFVDELPTWIDDVGAEECVVVAANRSDAIEFREWLQRDGLQILTARQALSAVPECSQMYVVGPPIFYPRALATAAVTDEISYLVSDWFRCRKLPTSSFAEFAEKAVVVKAHVRESETVEVVNRPAVEQSDALEEYVPEPIWGKAETVCSVPQCDEALARKLYLSGGFAMWLDDGQRIRSLDPNQPVGERVTYTDVESVTEGSFLLLREGASERETLYKAAFDSLGHRAADIAASQTRWKRRLDDRLQHRGHRCVEDELKTFGVTACEQVRAWTDPILVRPKSKRDFRLLLDWLGVPVQSTADNADMLKSALRHESQRIRKELEDTIEYIDLDELERIGYVSLGGRNVGVRGICATRVLAISHFVRVVARSRTRLLIKDDGGRWLE